MPQRPNFKLSCAHCGEIYLHIPHGITNSTVIHCSTCGSTLGTWLQTAASFIADSGQNDGFGMRDAPIIGEVARDAQFK
ncbi:hypothetical protein C7476_101712 [Phyllobacterium bourgognense]|uniref:Uncharacterized protein n=1 Tax=Phyllobacterium bourgognense TaxID=314236 RepID=A0A368Z6A0_9HYPH|nr:hypothetical protein C7476_101712 [Phyllobacterium bourgognense]